MIKVMTYNVWCDGPEYNSRLNRIFSIIKDQDPDVLVLQEVMYGSYNLIRETLNDYHCELDRRVEFNRMYGEIILSKFPIEKMEYTPFIDSPNIRGMTICDILAGSEPIRIITTHLEMNEKLNAKNITELESMVNKNEKTILAGDLNIFHGPREIQNLNEVITENTFQNKRHNSRPDRVYFNNLEFVNSNVIRDKVASDHYTLTVTFNL